MGGTEGAPGSEAIHPELRARGSTYEVRNHGITRMDYRTAHTRAGDAGYTQPLPATCQQCWENEASREELGLPAEKEVDESWHDLSDGSL